VAASSRVVLVEDDTSMREAIERLLHAAGFECSAYASAEALLACDRREGTACIVSDLRLPAMSGLELLAQLRSRGERTPLILITAHDAPGLRQQAMKRGAAGYLAKPFRGTALIETIKQVAGPAGKV
jgi:FixJ family two-component response regulator